jgi:rubrerythrin
MAKTNKNQGQDRLAFPPVKRHRCTECQTRFEGRVCPNCRQRADANNDLNRVVTGWDRRGRR